MDPVDFRILEESRRFRAALPELLKQHAGKWVVFKDGEVRIVTDDEDSAYVWGLEHYGARGGFVVAPVDEDQGPRPATFELAEHA